MSVVLAYDTWRTNADLIYDAWRLGYVHGFVYDVTPGLDGMWTKRIRAVEGIEEIHGNAQRLDFRHLAFNDNTWDTVLYDPPYKLNGNPDGLAGLSARYGVDIPTRWQDRHALMIEGLIECARIVRPGGHVLAKCQDQVVSGKLRWQTDMLTDAGICCGLEKVDRFDMAGHHIPQPMQGRKQKHAHGRPSTLLVFEKR